MCDYSIRIEVVEQNDRHADYRKDDHCELESLSLKGSTKVFR